MLPTLSNTPSTMLQLVVPTAVQYANLSARRHALLEMKKVVAVRVLDHTGRSHKIRYILETVTIAQRNGAFPSFDESSRSSTSSRASVISSCATEEGAAQSAQSSHKPAFRTEKKPEEFVELRNQVYYAAHTAHRHELCQFCTQLIEYLFIRGPKPDSMTLRLLGEERAKRKLTQFVTGLLELVVDHLSADVRGACAGQARIPQLLYEFLFAVAPQEAETA